MSQPRKPTPPEPPLESGGLPAWLSFDGFKKQAFVGCLVGFVLYFNSCFNEFAFDDAIVIVKNDYVQSGFKGIGKILTTDAYDSFYKNLKVEDQLSGGRYRPLSMVTFAIEHQLFGENWPLRHLINVALFLGSLVAMLYFLRTVVFPTQLEVAFLATLLFAIHPIHTEVVANVKSRDEIFSLLFMILTLVLVFQYSQNPRARSRLWQALGFFVLALLSKEYAVTLVVLIPLMIYLFSQREVSVSACVGKTLPFVAVVIVYLAVRFSFVVMKAHGTANDVLNNPYLFAQGSEVIATKISTLLNYVRLLLFPHPLSADYSYNQIPYKNFSHWSVWASLCVHGGLLYLAWRWIKQRHPLAFAVAFYLLPLSLVANLVFDIGATMGERLIYHSSIGFALAAAYYLWRGVGRLKASERVKKELLLVLCVALVAVYGYPTIARNADWENDITLFTKDVVTVPNSALANGNAGARWIDLAAESGNRARQVEYLNRAIGYLSKSIVIHPKYVNSYLNLTLAYCRLNEFEKARPNLDEARKYSPSHPVLEEYYQMVRSGFLHRGRERIREQRIPEAITDFVAAIELEPGDAEAWCGLGDAWSALKDYPKARAAWEKALEIAPDHPQAKVGMDGLPADSTR